jgi:uncharacterized protein YndB with AHSA1/START domain
VTTKTFDLKAWLDGTERKVNRDGDRVRSVELRRRFDAPVDKVWMAWVDGWKTRIVSGEPEPGATVILELGQPKRTVSRILVCEAPRRLAVTWTYGDATDVPPDEVEVQLEPDGKGTWLTLQHRSESGAPWADGVGAGWESGLMIFDSMFRGEDPSVIPPDANPKLDALWTELVGRRG